jgi:hypothetical protein
VERSPGRSLVETLTPDGIVRRQIRPQKSSPLTASARPALPAVAPANAVRSLVGENSRAKARFGRLAPTDHGGALVSYSPPTTLSGLRNTLEMPRVRG